VADVPRRATLGRLTRTGRAGLVALAALFAPAAGVAAQTPEAEAAPSTARALVDLDLRLAALADHGGLVGGLRAMVETRPGLCVGLGIHRVLQRVVDDDRIGPGRSLSLGYAGAVIEGAPSKLPFRLRLLIGAGVASLRDRAVGTRVGSDVSFMLVPEAVVGLARAGPVGLDAAAGYRLVLDADGPGRIAASDLRTPFLALALRLGPR
jgi:hypothetical protein